MQRLGIEQALYYPIAVSATIPTLYLVSLERDGDMRSIGRDGDESTPAQCATSILPLLNPELQVHQAGLKEMTRERRVRVSQLAHEIENVI
jgi:hypothetical protein